jgi:hypothetical protein
MPIVAALFESLRGHVAVSSSDVSSALSPCRVNTSLSGTLFF